MIEIYYVEDDAYVIADFARVGRIAVKPWRGSQYLALRRLTRHRMHITECIARESGKRKKPENHLVASDIS